MLCVFLCVQIHAHMRVSMCVEARDQCQILFLRHYVFFKDRFLYWPGICPVGKTGWPVSSRVYLFLLSQPLDWKDRPPSLAFYMAFGTWTQILMLARKALY